MQTPDAKLQQALLYAAKFGWRVFPCHSVRDGECSCGNRPCSNAAKHPRIKDMLKAATTNEQQIREWWEKWPDANVGIATGDGLVVVDVDPRHGGDVTLAKLEAELGPLPRQFHANTGGGGEHIYLSIPKGIRLQAKAKWTPAIDVQSEGRYVVAPPSNHSSGGVYEWVSLPVGSIPPSMPDQWLAELPTTRSSESSKASTDNTDTTDTSDTTDNSDSLSVVSVQLTQPDANLARHVAKVVERCVVTAPGETNGKITKLARRLKSISDLQSRDAEDFEPLIRWWYERSLGHMSDKDWQAVWGRWLYLWATWAEPGFDKPWEAYKLAVNSARPPEAAKYPSSTLRLLIAICRIMQERFADERGVWYLSCRDAGDLIGIPETTISEWLRRLCRDRLLKREGEHVKGSMSAQRYRYLGAQTPSQSESKPPPDSEAA